MEVIYSFFKKLGEQKAPRYWIVLFIFLATSIIDLAQKFIGTFSPPSCGLLDRLQDFTMGINTYLHIHPKIANSLIIAYSAIGDVIIIFLIGRALFKRSIRPILPLFIFLFFRQFLQSLVTFPIPEGMIWHYPGFPSLFSHYSISNDFYFSAYIGINVLANLELKREGFHKLRILGIIFIILDVIIDIVLRSHFITDMYTSFIVGFFSFMLAQYLFGPIDRFLKKIDSFSHYLLGALVISSIILWYTTEYFIGQKPTPVCVISDALHKLFLPINLYLNSHPSLENIALIMVNDVTDLCFIVLLLISIYSRNIRPIMTLFLFCAIRQILQMAVSLPIPPHIIWHDPGFPSLTQTYSIPDDFYFSGHTGTATIFALEMFFLKKRWLLILGFIIVIYEILSLLTLEVHYTMDIFTAIITVFCLTKLSSDRLSPWLNNWFAKHSFK